MSTQYNKKTNLPFYIDVKDVSTSSENMKKNN